MIKITINKHSYKVKTRWQEVNTTDLEELEFIETLKDIYLAKEAKQAGLISKLTQEQITKELPEFYRKALVMFSNIPAGVIQYVPFDDVTTLYQNTIETLVYQLITLNFIDYVPRRVKVKAMTFNGIEIPSYDTSARSWCEAVDTVGGARVDYRMLKLLPLIYSQKRYNEAELMRPVKMKFTKVLDFFFITLKRWLSSKTDTRRYSRAEKKQKCQKLESEDSSMSYPSAGLEQFYPLVRCGLMNF